MIGWWKAEHIKQTQFYYNYFNNILLEVYVYIIIRHPRPNIYKLLLRLTVI
jgi:hypothetical protein